MGGRSGVWIVLGACLLTAGCTGTSSGNDGSGDLTPTLTSPTCDNSLIAHRLGLAAGAVHGLIWKPYAAGSFATGAAARSTALSSAGEAAMLASGQLTRAAELVHSCSAASVLEEPLRSASARVSGVAQQLSAGTVDAALLGGLDSAVSAIESQSGALGITIVERTPTPSELRAAQPVS
jgi:hypothetical protein